VVYIQGGIYPGTPSQVHQYASRTPTRTARLPARTPLTALTRLLAELNIRNAGVTVAGVTEDPFHCWSMLLSCCE